MDNIRNVGQFTRQFSDQSPYDTEFQALYADFLKKAQYLNDTASPDVFWEEITKLNALCTKLYSQYFNPSIQTLAKDPSIARFITDLRDEILDVQNELKGL